MLPITFRIRVKLIYEFLSFSQLAQGYRKY